MRLKKTLPLLLAVFLLLSALWPASAGRQTRYLVLGDSIGFGAGVSNPSAAAFGRIVADTNGYDYRNDAHNSDTTGAMLAKLERETVAADISWADIISVSIGGNNFLLNDMTATINAGKAGSFSRMDAIVADYAADLERIVARIRALNPEAYILLQTLYNPAPGGELTAVYQEAVNRLNAAMRACAAAHPYHFAIVDVEAAFGADNMLISWDNIHPNAEGNVVIARAVLQTLFALNLGAETEPVIVSRGLDWAPTVPALFFRRVLAFFRQLLSALGKAR